MTTYPDKAEDQAQFFFDLMAEMDFTKHYGGMAATQELIELSHIDHTKYVLDVGCGVGFTPVKLAKTIGCRVMGVDLQEAMIKRAKARARQERVLDRVEFRVADARELPFEDGLFDVVMAESVLAFIPDRAVAMEEFVRVTKPGGYVAITEATWIREPSAALLALLSQSFGPRLEILSTDGWRTVLEDAGLNVIMAKAEEITVRSEWVNQIRRVGWQQIGRTWWKAIRLLLR